MLHAFIQQNDCLKSNMQPRRAFSLIPPPAPVLATRFLCGARHMLVGTVIMQHVHGYDFKDMLKKVCFFTLWTIPTLRITSGLLWNKIEGWNYSMWTWTILELTFFPYKSLWWGPSELVRRSLMRAVSPVLELSSPANTYQTNMARHMSTVSG